MIELLRKIWDGQIGRDDAVSVRFSDIDGKMVSVAFDGRYGTGEKSGGYTYFDYSSFSDCPVIDEQGAQHSRLSDIESLRVLRDSLNRMNLGD